MTALALAERLERGVGYTVAERPGWPVRWRCYLLDVGYAVGIRDLARDLVAYDGVVVRFVDARSGELVVLATDEFVRSTIVHPRDVDRHRIDLESIEEHVDPAPFDRLVDEALGRYERFRAYRAKCGDHLERADPIDPRDR